MCSGNAGKGRAPSPAAAMLNEKILAIVSDCHNVTLSARTKIERFIDE